MSESIDIKEQVPLAPYTTLRIGGPATYLTIATTAEHVMAAITWATSHHQSWYILGGGSNVLIPDAGINGLVILMRNEQLDWQPPLVTAGAGVAIGLFISEALKHGLGGLEWLVGIPGTIGGAMYGNAGGRDWWMSAIVQSVRVLDGQNVRTMSAADCGFTYRHSAFVGSSLVILDAQLALQTVDVEAEKRILLGRSEKKNAAQPVSAHSAGCMFRNPEVDLDAAPERLKPFIDQGKIAAWRCVAEVGMSGARIGQMEVSTKHANFLTNLGGGTADQTVQLLSQIKQKVRDSFGIQLHEEIQYLGFSS